MRKADPALHYRRRMEILEAAAICFVERGFHQTSMQEICDQAGMSPGALYRYFKSKAEIIEAIAEEDQRETRDFIQQIEQSESFIDGFLHAAESRINIALKQHYAPLVIEILAEAARNPKVAKKFIANDKQMKTALTKLIKTAIKNGSVNPNLKPDATAELLISIIEGIEGRAILNPGFKLRSVSAMLEQLIHRFLNPKKTPAVPRT